MLTTKLYLIGLALLFGGFALIAVGSFGGGNSSAGGFVLIGPIPILFGGGKYGGFLAILSVAGGLVMLLMVYLLLRSGQGWRTRETTTDKQYINRKSEIWQICKNFSH